VFTKKDLDVLYAELEKRDFPVDTPTLKGKLLKEKEERLAIKQEEIEKLEEARQKRASKSADYEKKQQLAAKQKQKAGFLTELEYGFACSNPKVELDSEGKLGGESVVLEVTHTLKRMVPCTNADLDEISQKFHTVKVYKRGFDENKKVGPKACALELHRPMSWAEINGTYIKNLAEKEDVDATLHSQPELRLPTVQELRDADVATVYKDILQHYGKTVTHSTLKNKHGQPLLSHMGSDVFVPVIRADGQEGDFCCVRSSTSKSLPLYSTVGGNGPPPPPDDLLPNGLQFRNVLFVMRSNISSELEPVMFDHGKDDSKKTDNCISPNEKVLIPVKEGSVILFQDAWTLQNLGAFQVPHNSKTEYHTLNKETGDLVLALDEGVPMVWFDESKDDLTTYEKARNYWREKAEEVWDNMSGWKMKTQIRSDAYKVRVFTDPAMVKKTADICHDTNFMRVPLQSGIKFVNETEFEFRIFTMSMQKWDSLEVKDIDWEKTLIGDWDPANRDPEGSLLTAEATTVIDESIGKDLFHTNSVWLFKRYSEALKKDDWCAAYIIGKKQDGLTVSIGKEDLRKFVVGDPEAGRALSDDLGE
jgi:hypothetical protein